MVTSGTMDPKRTVNLSEYSQAALFHTFGVGINRELVELIVRVNDRAWNRSCHRCGYKGPRRRCPNDGSRTVQSLSYRWKVVRQYPRSLQELEDIMHEIRLTIVGNDGYRFEHWANTQGYLVSEAR